VTVESYVAQRCRESKYLNESAFRWLTQDYAKISAVYSNSKRLESFCKWFGKTDNEIVESYKQAEDKDKWSKELGAQAVAFQNYLLKQDYAINTARAQVSGIRAFCRSQCTPLRIRRKAIKKARRASGEHVFTRQELSKMFFVANAFEKAVLSTAVALGYGSQDFLELNRPYIKNIVDKALAENIEFPSFEINREKTGESGYSHLTPEAIHSLKIWLDMSNQESEWVFHNHTSSAHITNQGLNVLIKRLAKKANINLVGKVRFHLFRKFLISACLDSDFNIYEAKYVTMKGIPTSDSTYLQTLKKSIDKKYPKLYENIRLIGFANHRNNELQELRAKVKQQDTAIKGFMATFVQYMKEELSKKKAVEQVESIVETYKGGRILSPKEVMEETLGRSLTDEEYEQLKQDKQYSQNTN